MSQKNYSEIIKSVKTKFPSMIDKTFEWEYGDVLRKTVAQFSALAGKNYSFTPAVPTIIQGRKYEIYFAYQIGSDKKIPRPSLRVAADYMTGNIVEYKDAGYSDFADGEKYPRKAIFDAEVPTAKTAREQMELLKTLRSKYEKVRAFAFKEELSSDERDILKGYFKVLKATVPKELLNFCMETEPKFFDWIKSMAF